MGAIQLVHMSARHVLFNDRLHAGQLLAERVTGLTNRPARILGLVRGGLITASPIALSLGLLPEPLVIQKISSPYNSEFAIGAVAPDSVFVVHWRDAQKLGVDEAFVKGEVARLSVAIKRRMTELRKVKNPIYPDGMRVMLVDDGSATGATMEAAILWARKKRAKEIIVALPVVSKEVAVSLSAKADAFIALYVAETLESVGSFYKTFPQVSDKEVIKSLQK